MAHLHLLLSLPLTDAAKKYYASTADHKIRKQGDVGVDLPFVSSWTPTQPIETKLFDFETIFALFDTGAWVDYEQTDWEAELLEYLDDHGFYGVTNIADTVKNLFEEGDAELAVQPFSVRSRSSVGKTPFRLSNSVGTIDSPYKGFAQTDKETDDTLKASVDYIKGLGFKANAPQYFLAGESLYQIVSPSLEPILPIRLDGTEADVKFWKQFIAPKKSRGGFGSTNKQ
jgi:hypothetical protein